MKYAILTMLFCLCGYGQEAYVVQLSPEDATQARQAWDALQTAQKNWEATQKVIALKYLIVGPDDPEASEHHYSEPVSITGNANSGLISLGSAMIAGGRCIKTDARGSLWGVPCDDSKPTPEQVAAQKAEEQKQAEAEKTHRDAYDKEKRVRRGFESDTVATPDYPPKFEFSHDFRYIVPPKPVSTVTPERYWPNMLVPATSGKHLENPVASFQ